MNLLLVSYDRDLSALDNVLQTEIFPHAHICEIKMGRAPEPQLFVAVRGSKMDN